jgi:hypothetical protein
VDWRDLFIKYVNIVGEAEGVDFLCVGDWTPEEWAEVDQARGEALDRYRSQSEAGQHPA